MKDSELELFIDDLESDRIERKESMGDGEKIRQAICAFSNNLPDHQEPSVLFVGVNDHGFPTGLQVTDDLLKNLAHCRDDGNILPFPSLTVQKRTLKGKDVAVVIVQPADAPPVRYKGTVWIRIGPRRGIATADDERRLNERRRYRDLPIDVRPIVSADLNELDELLFRRVYLPSAVSIEVLEQNQRSVEHQLVALKFAHPGPPIRPTMLGILTVGKNPTDWVPGAYVQFVRVDGSSLGEPVQAAEEIRGPLTELLERVDDLIKANIQSSVDITSADIEIRKPDYPLVAIQQVMRNAILHRTYESTYAPVRWYWFKDRIEIQNPGGPFGQVTKENFGSPGACDYRNPNLAGAMKELGYVQRFGFGIALTRREMERNGNPAPEFLVEDSHVAVILKRRP